MAAAILWPARTFATGGHCRHRQWSVESGIWKEFQLFGPELGFGSVMGWDHDEPVLLIKTSIGNRGLGYDVLPPGSVSDEKTRAKRKLGKAINLESYGPCE